MQKRNEELRERWRARLRELSSSGLSIAEFARRKGLNVKALYYWRSRVGGEKPASVVSCQKVGSAPPSFVQLGVTTSAVPLERESSIELEVERRYRLRMNSGFEAAELVRLLDVLEARR